MITKNNEFLKSWFLVLSLYTLSFGLMIFNKGLYWDDWVWFNRSLIFFNELSEQIGFIWFQYWLYFAYNNLIGAKIIVFTVNFISIILLYKILLFQFNRDYSFIITLLFSIVPVNLVRSMLCVSQYSLCVLFFLLGVFIVLKNYDDNRVLNRLLSYLLFFTSFEMNSILFFYLLFAIYLWWKKYKLKRFYKICIDYFGYLILPIAYLVVKHYFYSPIGVYQGYNTISIANILTSPFLLLISIYDFTIALLHLVITKTIILPITFLLFIIVFLFIRNQPVFNKKHISSISISKYKQFIFISFILIVCALLPYLVVGKRPSLINWDNRHSILLGFGLSLLLFTLLLRLGKNNIFLLKLVLALIITFFTMFNFSVNKELITYSFKLDSLSENLSKSEVIENNTTFLFVESNDVFDNILYISPISSEVLNGISRKVFLTEKKFFSPYLENFNNEKESNDKFKYFNYSEWIPNSIEYQILLKQNEFINDSTFLKLLYLSFLNHDSYKLVVKDLYSIECKEY